MDFQGLSFLQLFSECGGQDVSFKETIKSTVCGIMKASLDVGADVSQTRQILILFGHDESVL